MKVDIIDAKDAPAAPSNISAAADEAAAIVRQLKKGNVARVEPEGTQTIRALRVNLGRAAKAAGVKLITWDTDQILYVKLA
jgi:hypothetical protein